MGRPADATTDTVGGDSGKPSSSSAKQFERVAQARVTLIVIAIEFMIGWVGGALN